MKIPVISLIWLLLLAAMGFSQAQSIKITAPNGGERFYLREVNKTVTWTSTGAGAFVKIEYSSDGGITWNISSPLEPNRGSFMWPVPPVASEKYLIRITDIGNPKISDVSDKVFSVVKPSIIVTAPKEGEVINGCADVFHKYYYKWTNRGAYNHIRLYFSSDSGASWFPISGGRYNYPDSSSNYFDEYFLPANSTNCFLKVVENYKDDNHDPASFASVYSDSAVYGISGRFTVTNPNAGGIKIISPANGQVFKSGTRVTLKVKRTMGTPAGLEWYTSYDGGKNWYNVSLFEGVKSYPDSVSWLLPENAATYQIRVRDRTNCMEDKMIGSFSVTPLPKFTSIYPTDAGYIFYSAQKQGISWQTSHLPTDYVDIHYSVDGGTTWKIIALKEYNDGSYLWTLPATPSKNCRIKVSESANPALNIINANPFEIALPALSITSPAAGDLYASGGNAFILWESKNLTGFLTISLSLDGGNTWTEIGQTDSYFSAYTWVVPALNSTNCRVKITSNSIPGLSSTSPVFSIVPPAFTLLSPNGGEQLLNCSTQQIRWTASGKCYVALQYSTDNGLTWVTIKDYVESLPGTNSYNWVVPTILSSKCLFRVKDIAGFSSDVSNSNFSIIQGSTTLELISPKGGENFETGTTQEFLHTGNNPVSLYVSYFYSTDGGKSWNNIDSYKNFGSSYQWKVPDIVSSDMKFRVMETTTGCIWTQNDVSFSTFRKPVVTVTAPNGGQTFTTGSIQTITWTSSGLSGTIDLDYSADGGVTWVSISKGEINDGTYSWKTPMTPSDYYFVRVTDSKNIAVSDKSNSSFKIVKPEIKLTSHNSGNINGCSVSTITWTSYSAYYYLNLHYSADSGKTWNIISGSVSNYNGTNSFSWTVPVNPGPRLLIKISDSNNPALGDTSDTFVNVLPPSGGIKLTDPAKGAVLNSGTTTAIKWTSLNKPNYVNIEYSADSGKSWTYIIFGASASTSSFNWTVPYVSTKKALVRVTDQNLTCNTAISDTFSISIRPEIVVNTPNTGEIWYSKSSKYIYWTARSLKNNLVDIEYTTDGGTTWKTIATAYSNNGYYYWSVPEENSSNCLIRVKENGNPSLSDVSNVPFTIRRSAITLLAPEGPGNLTGCSAPVVKWNYSGESGRVNIYYSTDKGTTWKTVAGNVSTNQGNNSFNWSAPDIDASEVYLKISDYNLSSVYDQNDVPFSLSKNTSLSFNVTAPVAGKILGAGTADTIRWTTTGLADQVNIQYSYNGGTNWLPLVYSAPNTGSYVWNVSTITGESYLMRVSDINNCIYDDSDKPFIVRNLPKLTVTTPNNGERYRSGSNTTIYWTSANIKAADFVKIEFSADSGKIWKTLAAKEVNDGSFAWKVPDTLTTRCLIKISSFADPAVYDVSDKIFTIYNLRFAITSPNGGETMVGCSPRQITWSGPDAPVWVTIEYSTDNGATWIIYDRQQYCGGTTSGSEVAFTYYWNVPAVNSDKVLVKVKDSYDPTVFDISDKPFRIVTTSPDYLDVIKPAAGEVLTGNSTTRLTWKTNYRGPSYEINYSKNKGKSWSLVAYEINATYGGWNLEQLSWLVPDSASDEYLINVRQVYNTCLSGTSGVFSVKSKPWINITAPLSGNMWLSQETKSITWQSARLTSDAVNVEYSMNNGKTWILLTENLKNTGWYQWTLPDKDSDSCLVRVSEYGNPLVSSVSNLFSIKRYFWLTSPVGGEVYSNCSNLSIRWRQPGPRGYINLYYSLDNGRSWKPIITAYGGISFQGAMDEYSYNWQLPSIQSDSCLIKISLNNVPQLYDISRKTFRINRHPERIISVTKPAGGESFISGEQMTVNWSNTGTVNKVNLLYSTNGGEKWNTIATVNNTTKTYSWVVPDSGSGNFYIKVEDVGNSCISGSNSKAISVSPALVWPGDTDRDKYADVYDLLPLGLYFNSTGPARDSVSIRWAGQPGKKWNKLQYNGFDLMSVDCNGDGTVSYRDTAAISSNYSSNSPLGESKLNAKETDPELYFEITRMGSPGDTLYAEIRTGRPDLQVTDLYGMALNLVYDQGIKPGSVKTDFAGNWLDPAGTASLKLSRQPVAGRVDLALVRTDKTAKTGNGKIAGLKFVTEKTATIVNLSIKGYRALDSKGNLIPFNVTDKSILLTPTALRESESAAYTLYPNPSEGIVTITSKEKLSQKISVLNVLGEEVYHGEMNSGKLSIDMTGNSGVYFVKIYSEQETVTKSFIVH
jgi:hypothetical protein